MRSWTALPLGMATRPILVCGAALSVLVSVSAFGQDAGTAGSSESAAEQAPGDRINETEAQTQPAAPGVNGSKETGDPATAAAGPAYGEEADRAVQLRGLMHEKLQLTDTQKARADELLEEYIRTLRERDKAANPDDRIARLDELKKKLQQAREDQDREAVRTYFREIRLLRGGGDVAILRTKLRAAIVAELDESQAERFRPLFREVLTPQRRRVDALSKVFVVRRALSAVELTEDQKEATARHFTRLRQLLAQADGLDDETVEKATAELRSGILKVMTSEQRESFERAEAQIGGVPRTPHARGAHSPRQPVTDKPVEPPAADPPQPPDSPGADQSE